MEAVVRRLGVWALVLLAAISAIALTPDIGFAIHMGIVALVAVILILRILALHLAPRLKADPAMRGTIILALTAYAMKGDEEKVMAAGCDGYVSKPIDTRALVAVVLIGMLILLRILRAHGGTVDIQSTPDVGTTVILRFPLKHRRVRTLEAPKA